MLPAIRLVGIPLSKQEDFAEFPSFVLWVLLQEMFSGFTSLQLCKLVDSEVDSLRAQTRHGIWFTVSPELEPHLG